MKLYKNKEKFANGEALLKAYTDLQAEFTRKCQKIKELEEAADARRQEVNCQTEESINDISDDPTFDKTEGEEERKIIGSDLIGTEEKIPQIQEDETVTNYKNPLDEKSGKPDSAESVYNGEKPQTADIDEQIRLKLCDPKFIDEVILNNPEITSRIIATYLTQLAGANSVKTLGKYGGRMFFSPAKRAKSLAEAREMAEKLLE